MQIRGSQTVPSRVDGTGHSSRSPADNRRPRSYVVEGMEWRSFVFTMEEEVGRKLKECFMVDWKRIEATCWGG